MQPAAPLPTLDEVVKLEQQVWAALEAGDTQADLDLLTEDFLGVYETGFSDRTGHAGQLDNGPTMAESRMSETQLRILADGCVLLAYRADYVRAGRTEPETMYITSIWEWRSDRWVNSFSQDTAAQSEQ